MEKIKPKRRVSNIHQKFCTTLLEKQEPFIEAFEIVRKAYNLGLEKICKIADKYSKAVGTHATGRGIAYNLENLYELIRNRVAYSSIPYLWAPDSYIAGYYFGIWDYEKIEIARAVLRVSPEIEILDEEFVYGSHNGIGLPLTLNYQAIQNGISKVKEKFCLFGETLQENLLRHIDNTQAEIMPIIEILKTEAFTHREKRNLCNAYKHLVFKDYSLKIPAISQILDDIIDADPTNYFSNSVINKWLRDPSTGRIIEEGFK